MVDFSNLEGKLSSGLLSRRQFMQMSLAAGIGAASASLIADRAFAQTPKRGGHAIFGINEAESTDSFDPEIPPGFFMDILRLTVHDNLFEISTHNKIVPCLAESFETNADASVWRVKLKSGVTFHDGKPVTPQDVVNSTLLHLGEKSKSPMKTVMAHLAKVAADGDTIVYTLSTPDADWPALLTERSMSILPTKDGEADWRSGIGCGPYKLEAMQVGVRAVVSKNTNDHRSDRGWFESIEFVGINDSTARMTSLMAGSIHVASRIPPQMAVRLSKTNGVKVVNRTGPGFYGYDMQLGMDALGNNDVRLALKYALDREKYVKTILAGYGTAGNDQPIGPTYEYYADIPRHSYDPDKARFHLKKAGLTSLDIELKASDGAFEGSVEGATLYAETARASGINIKPVRVPSDGYWASVWGKVPFFSMYWTGRTTEASILSIAYGKGAGWNVTGFGSDRLDKLVLKARGELDTGHRRELYTEAQRIVSEEGPSVVPAFYNLIDAVSDKIGMEETDGSLAWLDNRWGPSRWWFK